MKLPFFASILLFLAGAAAAQDPGIMQARTVIHADGTVTESVHDPERHEQRELTYNNRKDMVLTSKKIYLLNEKGQPVQGNIYDGRDVLKARAQFIFDELGRMSEERLTNLQGEVYQTISFTYDAQGNMKTPRSQTYNVQSPEMKPAVMDFTKTAPNRGGQGVAPGRPQGQGYLPPPGQPYGQVGQGAPQDVNGPQGNVPRLPSGQPVPPQQGALPPITVDMSPQEPVKKKSFFQRMFGKDKKGDKDKK